MFCTKCGSEVREDSLFCTACGQPIKVVVEEEIQVEETLVEEAPAVEDVPVVEEAPVVEETPVVEIPQTPVYVEPVQTNGGRVGFGKAIALFFKNYVNFSGRATRSEYWWAYLFTALVSFVASYIPAVGPLILVALYIPGLSISVRRLHDIGKSWTYLFMALIPIAGPIILIINFCKESDGDNQWGGGK